MLKVIDLFNKNPEEFIDIIKNNMCVYSIPEGIEIQAIYNEENNTIDFHSGDNFNTKIGSNINEIDNYFVDGLKSAIEYIKSKKNIIKNYKYILFGLYDGELYLISIIDKNFNINKDLQKIGKALNVKLVDRVFNGKLNSKQRDLLLGLLQENALIPKEEFNDFIKELFNLKDTNNQYDTLLFEFNKKDNKVIQCLLNCVHEISRKNTLQSKDTILKLKDVVKECNSDEDFIKLLSDYKTYNKLYNIGINLKDNEFSICENSLSPEIKKVIGKNNVIKRIYENYIIINYINKK